MEIVKMGSVVVVVVEVVDFKVLKKFNKVTWHIVYYVTLLNFADLEILSSSCLLL